MRDFLKQTFATVVGLVLFLTLGASGLVALLAIVAIGSREAGSRVEQDSILTIDLAQEITDSTVTTNPGAVIEALTGGSRRNTIPLRTVLQSLDYAAEDERIAGIYLSGRINPTGSGSGLATLQEVRQALQSFRESGKPIYAYDALGWSEREYYLVSVANQIFLNPTAALEFNGFSFETTFFAGALQKYGIGVQAVRAGRYKSAVEPFTRSNNSPEARQETQRLLTDLWNEFLNSVAQSRNLQAQKLQTIADQQGLLLPDQAAAANLIDTVAHEDVMLAELQKLTGETHGSDSFRQISLADYATVIGPELRRPSSRNQVAVIYAEGDIVSGNGAPGSIGGDALAELLRELRHKDAVKAIVLRVNSPGGSASASARVAREVYLTNQEKPVIVSMGSYAASGGYQISTNASRIFASPNTITGSIGVFGLLPNFQTIANNNGVTWDVVKTGRFADSSSVARPKTAEELAISQRVVDRLYDEFLALVAESRPIPKEQVAQIAQGRIWSGAEARRIGLIDELGGLETAIQAAAKAAKLDDDWQLQEYPRGKSFEFRLLGRLLGSQTVSAAPLDPITLELQKLQADLQTLQRLNDPLGIYSRLPFNPRIE
ncbi:MAG: signal peptide peptidase SppA [Synechococcales cyanobacterium C42_A2020_086]|jgi:protease-4|nr:signal peptide peptidase SppA [Synechococcales cyanobacterium M58_A2018_015]MBF2072335.1 signal peptide peptidase SppA [Synechococcales cyanobacterium C42_A2020_086]